MGGRESEGGGKKSSRSIVSVSPALMSTTFVRVIIGSCSGEFFSVTVTWMIMMM